MNPLFYRKLRRWIVTGTFLLIFFGPSGLSASASHGCPEGYNPVDGICIKVNDLSDPGETDEINYADADQRVTLRMAVDAINNNAATSTGTSIIYFDTSLVTFGTSEAPVYVESTIALTAPLEIRANVTIIGPTPPESNTVLLTIERAYTATTDSAVIIVNPGSGENRADSEVTIMNLQIDSGHDDTEGRAIKVNAISPESNIALLTISNVTIENASTSDSGGAIMTVGKVVIEDSHLQNNSADQGGGAVFAVGSVTVKNSVFDSNTSTGNGGAIQSASEVLIENSQFKNNTASDGNGGAVYAVDTVIVTNMSVFESNTATRSPDVDPSSTDPNAGGAIFSDDRVISLSSQFTSNQAEIGGAIAARSVEIESSTFHQNSAALHPHTTGDLTSLGGAVAIERADETSSIIGSTFRENSAGMGGAISVSTIGLEGWHPAELEISESRFIANESTYDDEDTPNIRGLGGAILSPFHVSLSINQSIFESNTSTGNGGAIGIEGGYLPRTTPYDESNFVLSNSEFTNNSAELDGGAIYFAAVAPLDLNIEFNVSISTDKAKLSDKSGLPTTSRFVGNQADKADGELSSGRGGAIFASSVSGDFSIVETDFQNNLALEGGAIYIESRPSLFFDSELIANLETYFSLPDSLSTILDAWQESIVQVENSRFIGNESEFVGGAIRSQDEVIIRDSYFSQNFANQAAGAVGAGRVTIERSEFLENSSGLGGALAIDDSYNECLASLIFLGGYSPCSLGDEFFALIADYELEVVSHLLDSFNAPSVIVSSTFRENAALSEGGAIWGYVWLFFNTFINNHATVGSAISLEVRAWQADFTSDPPTGEFVPLSANFFAQSVGNFFYSDSKSIRLCSTPFQISLANEMTDFSCAELEEELMPIVGEALIGSESLYATKIDLVGVGETIEPSSTLPADVVDDLQNLLRGQFADFLYEDFISFLNPDEQPPLGLAFGVLSLVYDLSQMFGPVSQVPDTAKLMVLADTIFGSESSLEGIWRDSSGSLRPNSGCWTFGAVQDEELGATCGIVPENHFGDDLVPSKKEVLLQPERVSRLIVSASALKPRVATDRELARKARLAQLKARIKEIRAQRLLRQLARELREANRPRIKDERVPWQYKGFEIA